MHILIDIFKDKLYQFYIRQCSRYQSLPYPYSLFNCKFAQKILIISFLINILRGDNSIIIVNIFILYLKTLSLRKSGTSMYARQNDISIKLE